MLIQEIVMKNKNVITIPIQKPRNPLGIVKMTGAGSHQKSNKTMRQQDKKNIRNSLSNIDKASDGSLDSFILLILTH